MLKKIFCIVIVIAMVLGLVACSTPSTTETPSTEASTEVSTETSSEETASTEATPVEFPEMTITFSTPDTENAVTAGGINSMKDYIEEATDSKVTFDLNFNSSLFPQDQEMEAVMQGNCDMNICWFDWLAPYMPELNTLNVPYLFATPENFAAFFKTDTADQLCDTITQKTGIHVLRPVYYRGMRTVNLRTDKKITTREDLKNVKLRMPNSPAYLAIGRALGANSVPLGGADIYLGLQTGTIDGQDNAVSLIRSSSFYEVTESVTMTGHVFSAGVIMFNDEKWQSMSPELQQIINEGAQKCADYITNTTLSEQADDIAFLEENGVKVYQLTDDELASYSKEVTEAFLADESIAKDIDMTLYQSIVDAQK